MRERGFTLIEVLVVIAIISVLMGLVLPSLMKTSGKAKITETSTLIMTVKVAVEEYERVYGDYPPTSLREEGYTTNGINDGIESLIAHLASKGRGGPFIDIEEKYYANLDNDEIPSSFPLELFFGDSQAREIVDSWGNPLVYFHRADYDSPKKYMCTYKLFGGKTASGFRPGKSEKTGTFHAWSSFQLWSMGPNGKNENGEGDDIGSWGKQ
jgi:prepilin-type N-terminal cleavage/methylation domain-containing protein